MEKIFEILKKLHPDRDYSSSADFIDEGLLESMDIIALVSEIENEYGIVINFFDIGPENFSSAKAICDLINSKSESKIIL